MEKLLVPPRKIEAIKILLIGNNPTDLTSILQKMHEVRQAKVVAEIAFDIQSFFDRILTFKPNFILVDDNIGKLQFNEIMGRILRNHKIRETPVAVIKNSNYTSSWTGNGIYDFLLKHNLTAEALYKTWYNSARVRKTQESLKRAYQKRKDLLRKIKF